MSRIEKLFRRKANRILNIYCTAGYPQADDTLKVIRVLQENGADMIELGMPYSDPLADGPVIQHSGSIAIANGMTIATLFEQLKDGDVVVTGNGTAYTSTFQAMFVKKGVRVFANQGCAAMGYDLPAAIGACVSNPVGKTILITGDGSIQMNIQELQTIKTYNLPVKIFVLENEGYLAIKTTQKSFFNGRFIGSNPQSGVVCPDLMKISAAYGINFERINDNNHLIEKIEKVLGYAGPCICEITMNPEQTLFPKSSSSMDENGKMVSQPLERMFPFLPEPIQEKCYYNSAE